MLSVEETLHRCEERIGYVFRDRILLKRCLTHSSAAETRLDSNERLEFLGDAVLGLVIVEHLFQLYPGQREGQLTQMKSWLVSRQTCARVARAMQLGELILVGRGLQSLPDSILSAVVESIIGGVYLDGGLCAARSFILNAFQEELGLCQPVDTDNFKSQLQEYTQRELGCTPEYRLVEESGPDHAREFGIQARVGESDFEIGRGRSKKEAEQQAARNAVQSLMRLEQAAQLASEPAPGMLVEISLETAYSLSVAEEAMTAESATIKLSSMPPVTADSECTPEAAGLCCQDGCAEAGPEDDFGMGCDLAGYATPREYPDSSGTRDTPAS